MSYAAVASGLPTMVDLPTNDINKEKILLRCINESHLDNFKKFLDRESINIMDQNYLMSALTIVLKKNSALFNTENCNIVSELNNGENNYEDTFKSFDVKYDSFHHQSASLCIFFLLLEKVQQLYTSLSIPEKYQNIQFFKDIASKFKIVTNLNNISYQNFLFSRLEDYFSECIILLIKESNYVLLWFLLKRIRIIGEELGKVCKNIMDQYFKSEMDYLLSRNYLFDTISYSFNKEYFASVIFEAIKVGDTTIFMIFKTLGIEILYCDTQRKNLCKITNENNVTFDKLKLFIEWFYVQDGVLNSQGLLYLFNRSITIMYAAVQNNNIKLLEYLLSSQVFYSLVKRLINSVDYITCKTCCVIALENGSIECLRLLLIHGANFKDILDNLTDKAAQNLEKLLDIVEELNLKDEEKKKLYFKTIGDFYKNKVMCTGHFVHNIIVDINYKYTRSLDEFNTIINETRDKWLSKNVRDKGLWPLHFNLNDGSSTGSGVRKHMIEELSTLLLANPRIICSVFNMNSDPADKAVLIHNCFDINNMFMYIPYYHNLIEADVTTYKNFAMFLSIAFLFQPVNLKLSPIFFKFISGEPITLDDFMPPDVMRTLHAMENYNDEDFENLGMTMSVISVATSWNPNNKGCSKEEFSLIPNGRNILLTKNRFQTYKEKLLDFYLNQGYRNKILTVIRDEFNGIINQKIRSKCLYDCISARFDMPTIYDWIMYTSLVTTINSGIERGNIPFHTTEEISKILEGLKCKPLESSEINIELIYKLNHKLQRSSRYKLQNEHIWFFQIVNEMSKDMVNKLIKFICGTSSQRINLVELINTSPIQINIYTPYLKELRYPNVSMCSNIINFPIYKNKEEMKRILINTLELSTEMTEY
jgi:hypothetical protein